MRGRHRKNPKLKILHGDTSKRPSADTPTPAQPSEIPEPFEWMTPDARAEWLRVTPHLHARGLLTQLDLANLAAYCETLATYLDAHRTVQKEGAFYVAENGLKKRHPAATIVAQAARDLAMFGRELGLLPLSRQRLGASDEPEEADPLAAFLGGPAGSAPRA